MRRVVVTGIGVISSIGNDKEEVRQSLRDGRSGIIRSAEFEELGLRSHVFGPIKLNAAELIADFSRRLRWMIVVKSSSST